MNNVVLPSSKKKDPTQSRFKKFISTGRVNNLPSVARLPALSKSKSLAVPPKTTFDPCSTAGSVCLNGGKCKNNDGNFVCHCPPTHYGKKCEILSNLRKCEGNLCKNGAACVSTPNAREIVDPDKAAALASKKNRNTLTEAEMQSLIKEVEYDCICAPGIMGPLCELSEEELKCQEDYCMSRGSGKLTNGKCTCDCHANYIGKRCETENPCKSYECFNSGICTPKIDSIREVVEAKCTCTNTELIQTSITGLQCETISLKNEADESSPLLPCKNGGNFVAWKSEMEKKLTGADKSALSDWLNSCETEKGHDCSKSSVLTKTWCMHGETCEARAVKFPSGKSYLFPICLCNGFDEGKFCEYSRKDACDPSRDERAANTTRESKCTAASHGTCVDIQGEAKCDCRNGFVGEQCETYDPCASNPCTNAECIPIPSETVMVRGRSRNTFRCICDLENEMQDASTCVFKGTGNCTSHSRCNQGECITCEHSEEEQMLQLCTQEEQKNGFKCICKPGFLPPFCEKEADACTENLCENGADCVVRSKYDYRCKCLPGTKGSLCEEIVDFCLAFGTSRCVHGSCYEDASVSRGFSCECAFSNYGRNCEFEMGWLRAWANFIMKYYQFFMPLISILFTSSVLVCAYFCCARKSERKTMDVESVSDEQESIRNRETHRRVREEYKKRSVEKRNRKMLENRSSSPKNEKQFTRPPPSIS